MTNFRRVLTIRLALIPRLVPNREIAVSRPASISKAEISTSQALLVNNREGVSSKSGSREMIPSRLVSVSQVIYRLAILMNFGERRVDYVHCQPVAGPVAEVGSQCKQ